MKKSQALIESVEIGHKNADLNKIDLNWKYNTYLFLKKKTEIILFEDKNTSISIFYRFKI